MKCFVLQEMKHYTIESIELKICNAEDLQMWLARYSKGESQVISLRSPSGESMTIGVGGPLAFVEFVQASKDPPYLVAQ
jgi:hypothetical protein